MVCVNTFQGTNTRLSCFARHFRAAPHSVEERKRASDSVREVNDM